MLFAEKPELVCSKKLCGMLLESKELNQNNNAIENIEDEINKFKNPHNKHKLENIGEEENKPKKKRSEIIPVTFAPYSSKAAKKENPKKTIYYPKYSPRDESGNKKEIKKKSMPIQNSMIQPSPTVTTLKDDNIDVQLIYRRHSMPIKRDGVKINSKSNNTSPEIKGHTKKTSSQPVSPQQPLSPKLRGSNNQQQKQKSTQQQQQQQQQKQQQQRQVTQKRKQPDSTYILFISLFLISGLIICFGIANLFSN